MYYASINIITKEDYLIIKFKNYQLLLIKNFNKFFNIYLLKF
jgi:hypothetical protein